MCDIVVDGSGISVTNPLIFANGTLNLFGGAVLRGNSSMANAGGVSLNGGTLNMSGNATITGNTTSASCGGVYVNGLALFQMSAKPSSSTPARARAAACTSTIP